MAREPALTRIGNVRFKDGFQNFEAMYGLGTNNQMSSSRYGFTPLTRDRQQLDMMYRGSWVVRRAVGVPADDMTRLGVELFGLADGFDPVVLQNALRRLNVWGSLASTIRWGRLYGGSIAVILIEGQNLSEPLRTETVGKGQFKGLLPIDRWSLQPSPTLVDALGPDFGKPVSYRVITGNGDELSRGDIHHTRVVRFEGDDLPYTQRQYEMGWGMSIVESFHDRLVAFDSTTLGMAQMVYKAHLRSLKMKDLRKNIAQGGPAFAAALTQVDLIRRYQSTEGLTLLDADDEFQTDTYTFGGLSDVMIQMSQQIAGAVEIPLVKFFGMSPAGFSTGDSDLRSYNDNIHLKQERGLRHPLEVITHVAYRSEFGEAPPDGFGFKFASLYGLNDVEKANIAASTTSAIAAAEQATDGAYSPAMALADLKRCSEITGIFGSITDDAITNAEDAARAAPDVEPPVPEIGEVGENGVDPVSDPGSRDPEDDAGEADFAERRLPRVTDADFREEDHPRSSNGQFGSGGGSGSTKHTVYQAGDATIAAKKPRNASETETVSLEDKDGREVQYDLSYVVEGDKVHAVAHDIHVANDDGELIPLAKSPDHQSRVATYKLEKQVKASAAASAEDHAEGLTEESRLDSLSDDEIEAEELAEEKARLKADNEHTEEINAKVDEAVAGGFKPDVNEWGGWQRPDSFKPYASPKSQAKIEARLAHHGIKLEKPSVRAAREAAERATKSEVAASKPAAPSNWLAGLLKFDDRRGGQDARR